MKKENSIPIIIFLFFGIFLTIPSTTLSVYLDKDKAKQASFEFASNRLIVKLKTEADKGITLNKVQGKITTGLPELDKLNIKFKVEKQEKLFKEFKETALKSDRFSSVYVLEVPAGTDLKQMKTEYEVRPEVEYAELDYKFGLFESPNDPLFPHQWYLNNLGLAQNDSQGYYGINRPAGHLQIRKFGKDDADIDALESFERKDEKTVPLVGIIDTGVDTDHEDLADNVWTNPGEIPDNGIDDDHNGFVDDFYGWDFSGDSMVWVGNIIEDNDPTDYYGHGTHVAGIVAAIRDNGIGVSGINTPCKIMAIKFFPNSYSSIGAKSIVYAADMGCDVINMSWGAPFPSRVLEEALDYSVTKGVLPIAAAGNSGGVDYYYPAFYPQVFAVGASNSKDEVTYFSTYGKHIEVVAPGEDILSLRADNTDMYAEDGYPYTHIVAEKYYLADGTSMASPCAVGVAAYLLAVSPGISKEKVKEIMEQSADDIIYPFGGDSLYSPGKDIFSGYGRVNLNSALKLLSGRQAKIDYPYENAIVSGYVPIIGTASGDSFMNYVLEYGKGFSPQVWTELVNSTVKVGQDTLGIWNSSGLSGLYSIRLTVGDKNQEITHVTANNGTYVKITSPVQQDTIRGYAEIRGNTVVSNFSGYTLEYGYGESPSSWDTITTSTRMVADNILGKWVLSFVPEGTYTLKLSVKDTSRQVYMDEVRVTIKSIATGGWFRNLSSWGSLSPAVGDINGDGYDEVIVGVGSSPGYAKTGGLEVFTHQGEREPGWPRDTDKGMMSSPALGDLDGDGIDDIVICSYYGVHAYLSNSANWFRSAITEGNNFWSLATPVIADLEKDGYFEVLMINNSGTVYAWRNNGEPVIPGGNGVFAYATGSNVYEGFPCLAVADLDRDGENEVIAGSAYVISGEFGNYTVEGGIYIWDINGNQLLSPKNYPYKFGWIYGLAITNVDADEDLEVITFGQNEHHPVLCAFKKDGTQASGFPVVLEDLISGWWWGNHPAVGDLDGDGVLEIVVSMWTVGDARIYAWHQDGTPLTPASPLIFFKSPDAQRKREVLSGFGNSIGEITAKIKSMRQQELDDLFSSFKDTVFASVVETFGSPILADVNADGKVEIIAHAGYYYSTGYERVFAWDYEGDLIPGWPIYTSAVASALNYYPYSPVIADIDKDGKLNLITDTDWPDFKLTNWELDIDYDSKTMHWPKYMHDKWNSGIFKKEDYTEAKDEEKPQLPASFALSQNFPNPFNSETVIEYSLPEENRVKIVIYNILGQKVKTLLEQKLNPGYKRIVWDGKDDRGKEVTSGVYFYRLETSGYKETKKMILLR